MSVNGKCGVGLCVRWIVMIGVSVLAGCAVRQLDGTPMDGVVYRLRPDPRGQKAMRGIVVALRPLSGAAYIRPVVNELRNRGWVVIESSLGFGIDGVGDERNAKTDGELEN